MPYHLKPHIIVRDLSHHFGSIQALKNIELLIHPGETLAMLGPNGAGKTSLIKLLLGRLKQQQGTIEVFQYSAGHHAIRHRIGVALQNAGLPEQIKVREHIELFLSYYPEPLDLEQVLITSKLETVANRRFSELSGGQKQRCLLALAICGNPDLIFLDEPTVGLDVEARQDFWNAVRQLSQQGKTIVLTTHYLQEAEALADRIILLKEGRIIHEGSTGDLKNQLSGSLIRFRSDKPSDAYLDIPYITRARNVGGFVELASMHPDSSLQTLIQQETRLPELTVSGLSLEDVFLQLTSETKTADKQYD